MNQPGINYIHWVKENNINFGVVVNFGTIGFEPVTPNNDIN